MLSNITLTSGLNSGEYYSQPPPSAVGSFYFPSLRLQTPFAPWAVKQKTPPLTRQGFFFVAEGGFEPPTFGL